MTGPAGARRCCASAPADGPVVVAVLPLFEEANRTRAVTVAILRALGDRGIAGALPDLPGTGESLVALADTSLADWRSAFAAAVASLGQPVHAMTARGGALVEAEADLASRWHLTPVAGEDLVRDLFRMRAIADPGAPRDFDPLAPSPEGPPVELAGNLISRQMLCELIAATPARDRGDARRAARRRPAHRQSRAARFAAVAARRASIRSGAGRAARRRPRRLGARMRRLIEFPCRGDRLMGSLDEAPGRIGLLIVSGGNEIRAGAHRGMAILAQRVAAAGAPVFRFDRRGVGDSTGTNLGFANSAEDIAAAAATFTAEAPQLQRVVAFGNCDAATALALFHHVGGINALLLANPWVIEQSDALPPRRRDPRALCRAAQGSAPIAAAGHRRRESGQAGAGAGQAVEAQKRDVHACGEDGRGDGRDGDTGDAAAR